MQLTVAGIVLLGLYLISKCHGVQMPAHLPLSTLVNARCAHQVLVAHANAIPSAWHNFPVYIDFYIHDISITKTTTITQPRTWFLSSFSHTFAWLHTWISTNVQITWKIHVSTWLLASEFKVLGKNQYAFWILRKNHPVTWIPVSTWLLCCIPVSTWLL